MTPIRESSVFDPQTKTFSAIVSTDGALSLTLIQSLLLDLWSKEQIGPQSVTISPGTHRSINERYDQSFIVLPKGMTYEEWKGLPLTVVTLAHPSTGRMIDILEDPTLDDRSVEFIWKE